MQFNIVTVLLFAIGATLLYAGIKNIDPRSVVSDALNNQSPSAPKDDAEGVAGPAIKQTDYTVTSV